MTRIAPLAAAALLCGAAAAPAKLELHNVKAVHGQFGPERKSLDVYPGDQVFFTFAVRGAKVDDKGEVSGLVKLKLADEAGKALLEDQAPLKGALALGGDTLPGKAFVNFGETVKPGTYTLTVTVLDQATRETASFERKLVCKAPAFTIVAPRFSYDDEGKVPAPLGGLVGQVLFFRLAVIGFDKSAGKIHNEMAVQVLDGKGNPAAPRPLLAKLESADKDVVAKATSLTFRGNFVLNRAGEYTLRITVTDRLADRKTTFEAPLSVREP
jgi:hypothetical protein